MRKALFATVVAGGIAPFLSVGCSSNNGQMMANNNTSTDWFGAKKLASLFKSDDGPMDTTDEGNPHDPTSLAYKGDPPGADLFVASAHVAEQQNNAPAAADQYQRALEISPTNLAALVGYAHLLDREGKLDEAASYYEKAAQNHPQDASAHNDLGLCYARRGMLNESLVELSKAVELSPAKKLYRNNIATVFVELGQPERALEHLSFAEQKSVAHYNLACLLNQRGQTQGAAFHFAQAAQHDPSLVGAKEWSQKLAAAPAGARMTNVLPVDSAVAQQSNTQPSNTQWPPAAVAKATDSTSAGRHGAMNGRGAVATDRPRLPQTGADRNWAAYDVASQSAGSSNGASAARGSAYAAVPPTPESAGNYSIPASAEVDLLPPVETSVPRY